MSPDRDTPLARADALLSEATVGLGPAEAAAELAVLASRAAVRLQGLARATAAAERDAADWPAWAQLQNAARTLVLQASTCRDLAQRLPAPLLPPPPPSDPGSP